MNSANITDRTQGFRGYIGSRVYDGLDFPQNVQNFLIRSYCQKHQLNYLLSATEYKMPGCYMMLEEVLSSIELIDGIVLFSIFMLPECAVKRKRIYNRVLNTNRTLHAALEDMAVRNFDDVHKLEDILKLNKIAVTDHSIHKIREFCDLKNAPAQIQNFEIIQ